MSSLNLLSGRLITLGQPRPHDPLQLEAHEGDLASESTDSSSESNSVNSLQTVNKVRSTTTAKLCALQPFGNAIRRFNSSSD